MVIEIETVTAAIRKLWSEGGFKSKNVVLGIGNQRVIARDLTMPKVKSLQQIREALPFQVQDLLPVPVAQALLDFYPISESTGDSGPVVNGLLIAAVKDSVIANVTSVRKAGLMPLGVDLIAFALSRALVRGPLFGATVAIIDIGASTTQVVVTSGGVPRFVRMIPAASDDITRAIMERLAVPREQAESIKRSRGISTVPPVTELDQRTSEVISASTYQLLSSIRNTLHYYGNNRSAEPIQGIVLTGNGGQLEGLSAALAAASALQVVVADPFSTVDLTKSFQKQTGTDLRSMTVALGLALGRAA